MTLSNSKLFQKKQQSFIKLIIYITAILILLFLFIKPSINEIKKTHNNILNEKIKIQKNIDREKNMSKLSEEVKEIEPRMEKFSQIFINQNRELEFITQLEKLAKDNNVKQNLNLQQSKKTTSQNTYSETPINIDVQGSMNNALNYLQELERLNYYININNLKLSTKTISGFKSSFEEDNSPNKKEVVILNIKALSYWK